MIITIALGVLLIGSLGWYSFGERLSSKGNDRLAAAAKLEEQGDFDGAESAYRKVLEGDPNNVACRRALARLADRRAMDPQPAADAAQPAVAVAPAVAEQPATNSGLNGTAQSPPKAAAPMLAAATSPASASAANPQSESAEDLMQRGIASLEGKGTPKDPRAAYALFLKAAELGHAGAMAQVGSFYSVRYPELNEVVGGVNDAKAVEWFRKSADKGDSAGQMELGRAYRVGNGVPKDVREAYQWIFKAASQGQTRAWASMGIFYDSSFPEGNAVVGGADDATAAEWYRKAGEAGIAIAQSKLAMCYRRGKGVKKDVQESYRWCLKSAEQEDSYAYCQLGDFYRSSFPELNSMVGGANDATAFSWYRKAADKNSPTGQRLVGYCFMNGIGVEKDPAQARTWLLKAAEQGDASARKYVEKLDAKPAEKPATEKAHTVFAARYPGFAEQGFFRQTGPGTWHESCPDGTAFDFQEVDRRPEYIEIYDKNRDLRVRIYRDSTKWRQPKLTNGEWADLYPGSWQ